MYRPKDSLVQTLWDYALEFWFKRFWIVCSIMIDLHLLDVLFKMNSEFRFFNRAFKLYFQLKAYRNNCVMKFKASESILKITFMARNGDFNGDTAFKSQ